MLQKVKHTVFVFLCIPLFISCEAELKTEFTENECQPILHSLQYSWEELNGAKMCGGSTFNNTFWILADYSGCLDSTVHIHSERAFLDENGNQLGSTAYTTDQYYELIGDKIYFGYCVNWSTAEFLRVTLKVVTDDGKETNEETIIVPRQPGT